MLKLLVLVLGLSQCHASEEELPTGRAVEGAYYAVFRCEEFIVTHTPKRLEVTFEDRPTIQHDAIYLHRRQGPGVWIHHKLSPRSLFDRTFQVSPVLEVWPLALRHSLGRLVPLGRQAPEPEID